MDLGAFSVRLSVADMGVSREFYEKLGFTMVAGDGASWTIVANGSTAIGLFQGMFEGNILTFNPGWAALGEPIDEFSDVRRLRVQLTGQGLEVEGDTTTESESGPASFMITDPDGNVILFDQHV